MSSDKPSENTHSEGNHLKLKDGISTTLTNLSDFKLKEILQNSTNRKAVFLRGSFASEEGEAIIILEKTAFSDDSLLSGNKEYFPGNNRLETIFQNDIYGNYHYITDSLLNSKYFLIIILAVLSIVLVS